MAEASALSERSPRPALSASGATTSNLVIVSTLTLLLGDLLTDGASGLVD